MKRKTKAILFIIVLAWGSWYSLSACAMSAMIATSRNTLDQFPPQDAQHQYWRYNDPWDYFGFLMANSTPNGNADGYGVVAYARNSTLLSNHDRWYKRVLQESDFNQVYYTGPYLDLGDQTDTYQPDVLDIALNTIQEGQNHPAIVMCHARNATGLTYGNHPFTFELGDRTFSFMHNGNCNNARTFMINRINSLHPDQEWFHIYPSNYFMSSEPLQWVDSELLFHYIMCWIKQCNGNVLTGLFHALDELRPYYQNPNGYVYNFIMSDGEMLYAFRNSSLNSRYKLSYKCVQDQFIAIRTQTLRIDDIALAPMELVVFSQTAKPVHYTQALRESYLISRQQQTDSGFGSASGIDDSGIVLSPTPSFGNVFLSTTLPTPQPYCADVFNLRGQKVFHKLGMLEGSKSEVPFWNGRDNSNRAVASGVYILRITLGTGSITKKIVIKPQ